MFTFLYFCNSLISNRKYFDFVSYSVKQYYTVKLSPLNGVVAVAKALLKNGLKATFEEWFKRRHCRDCGGGECGQY